MHQPRVLDRDSAKDDAGKAFVQPSGDGCHVADAAAKLAGHRHTGEDRLDCGGIDRPAREGPVQIDEVQPLAARRHERCRLRCRVLAKDGDRRHVAAQQPDALPVLQINRRIEDHRRALVSVRGVCGTGGRDWKGRESDLTSRLIKTVQGGTVTRWLLKENA